MMNDFSELYKRIEYLRNNGTKMKEIADWVGMAPSVLSSLYTTVLPAYFESAKTMPQEEALDQALSLVNNVSKKKTAFRTGKHAEPARRTGTGGIAHTERDSFHRVAQRGIISFRPEDDQHLRVIYQL